MLKTIKVKNMDFFNHKCENASHNKKFLPDPLPWIEPSINMLHLECLNSYMFGNHLCSIFSMGALLEHVLKLALVNCDKCGRQRPEGYEDIGDMPMLYGLIEQDTYFIEEGDLIWWKDVAKLLRNKSAHSILPALYQVTSVAEGRGYLPEAYDVEPYKNDFAAFYHKNGYLIASKFILEGTEQVRKVINKTNWEGDESWWISQKHEYDSFFSFGWSFEDMLDSMNRLYS